MIGYEIYEKAMSLLGYTDSDGNAKENNAFSRRAVNAINTIGSDLCDMTPINNIMDEVTADEKTSQAMCYGVAMILSLCENDGEKNSVFTQIFNSKRTALKSSVGTVKDLLPSIGGI